MPFCKAETWLISACTGFGKTVLTLFGCSAGLRSLLITAAQGKTKTFCKQTVFTGSALMQNGWACGLLILQSLIYLIIPFPRLCGYYCLRQLIGYFTTTCTGYTKREKLQKHAGTRLLEDPSLALLFLLFFAARLRTYGNFIGMLFENLEKWLCIAPQLCKAIGTHTKIIHPKYQDILLLSCFFCY